jgi:hypothetical protein
MSRRSLAAQVQELEQLCQAAHQVLLEAGDALERAVALVGQGRHQDHFLRVMSRVAYFSIRLETLNKETQP